MCRWAVYAGPEIYLEDILFKQSNSIVAQSLNSREGKWLTNGDGFGLVWYNSKKGTPGLYKDILPAWNCANLRSLAAHIESKLFFTHVRRATSDIADVSRPNCHPFVYKNWSFMHNGSIGGWRSMKKAIESLISEKYYDHRRGSTDSEALFFLALSYGLEQDPIKGMETAFSKINELLIEKGIADGFQCCSVLTDGNTIWAFRQSSAGKQSPSLYFGLPKTAKTDPEKVKNSYASHHYTISGSSGESLKREVFIALQKKKRSEAAGTPNESNQNSVNAVSTNSMMVDKTIKPSRLYTDLESLFQEGFAKEVNPQVPPPPPDSDADADNVDATFVPSSPSFNRLSTSSSSSSLSISSPPLYANQAKDLSIIKNISNGTATPQEITHWNQSVSNDGLPLPPTDAIIEAFVELDVRDSSLTTTAEEEPIFMSNPDQALVTTIASEPFEEFDSVDMQNNWRRVDESTCLILRKGELTHQILKVDLHQAEFEALKALKEKDKEDEEHKKRSVAAERRFYDHTNATEGNLEDYPKIKQVSPTDIYVSHVSQSVYANSLR